MTEPTKTTVLVVDDEPAITRALTAALTARGYTVLSATSGSAAIDITTTHRVDLMILDVGLPDLDGVEVCRRVRQWSDAPIIMLTVESGEDRKVRALDEGADDYVTKPFSTPELLARVRAALRHHRRDEERADESVFLVGDLEVDLPHHVVKIAERPIDLTPKEFDFLALLARYPGRVLTHRTILQAVWGPHYGTETQYLRVYASQLRKKLGDDPDRPRIVTAPGVGYRLVDPSGEPA